jgi:hypothetical protein
LLVYIDDIIVASSSSAVVFALLSDLKDDFSLKDLGPLHYFLGIQVQHLFDGFRLSRQSILLIYYNGLLWSLQACPHTIVLQQQVHSS